MKTIRICGLLLMAVLISVGFSACSSDDDDTSNNGGGTVDSAGKKLVELKMTEKNWENGAWEEENYCKVFNFSYGKDGKLSQIKKTYSEGEYKRESEGQYAWSGSEIKGVDDEGFFVSYKIENNRISSKTEKDSRSSYITNYEYDDKGQLSTIKEEDRTYELIWNDNKLTKILKYSNYDNTEYTIEYSKNQTCKGFLPECLINDADRLELLYPSLFGLNRTCLPSKKIQKDRNNTRVDTYNYTLSKDNYVEKCEVTVERGSIKYQLIYTYKWE